MSGFCKKRNWQNVFLSHRKGFVVRIIWQRNVKIKLSLIRKGLLPGLRRILPLDDMWAENIQMCIQQCLGWKWKDIWIESWIKQVKTSLSTFEICGRCRNLVLKQHDLPRTAPLPLFYHSSIFVTRITGRAPKSNKDLHAEPVLNFRCISIFFWSMSLRTEFWRCKNILDQNQKDISRVKKNIKVLLKIYLAAMQKYFR